MRSWWRHGAGLPRRRWTLLAIVGSFLLSSSSLVRPACAADPLVITVDPQAVGTPPKRAVDQVRVASLPEALALRRRWRRADSRQAISIALAPGVHRLSEPVRFGREDSGTAVIPLVVYGAADGSTRLVGSVPLVPAPDGIPRDLDATLLVDRGAKLRVYRLPASVTGQRIQEPRTLARRDAPVHLALFDRAGALWPARWPNTGWARTASGVSVSSHNETKASFALADGRSARWRREPELWAEGYWRWNWLFEAFPVAAVAPDHLTLEATPYEGIASGARFRIVHALSELDAPGEWWRDAGWGVVLLWPRDPSDAVEVAVTDTLLSVEGASHLRIQTLTLEQAQGDLVRISEAADVVISGSRLRRTAGRALSIERSTASGLERSTVAETGIGGVRLSGGDRPSLIPAGLFVRDCRISDYAQSARTQSPAIMVDGVGQIVQGNYIHDTDEYAIHLRGNEHRVAWNEITRILSESTDSGAIYSGRDWSARGSVIEHNYLHNIRAAPGFEIKGIYLDDMASGSTVRDNLFVRVDQPIFLGGGRDNRIIENLFVDSSPAIHVDARGRTWAQDAITDPLSELRAAYAAMPVGGKLWRERYPGLATILADDPAAARNSLTDNVFLNSEPFRFGDLARSGEQNLTRNIGPAGLRLAPLTRSDEQVASRKESVKRFENVLDATNALVRRRDYDRMERSILLKPFEDNRPGHP